MDETQAEFCPYCEDHVQDFQAHLYSSSDDDFECQFCQLHVSNQLCLQNHRKRVHEIKADVITCQICFVDFSSENHFVSHQRLVCGNEEMEIGEMPNNGLFVDDDVENDAENDNDVMDDDEKKVDTSGISCNKCNKVFPVDKNSVEDMKNFGVMLVKHFQNECGKNVEKLETSNDQVQCGNLRISLSLRFYVKTIFMKGKLPHSVEKLIKMRSRFLPKINIFFVKSTLLLRKLLKS